MDREVEMQTEPVKSPSKLKQWFKRSWGDLALLSIVVACLVWMAILFHGNSPNKASWLLLPITTIYVVSNIYVAAAGFRAAQAAAKSAEIMELALREQRVSTQALFAPWISFPEGLKCQLNSDGTAEIRLTNLFNQPAAGLQLLLWEMETDEQGQQSCKFSSLGESAPTDFLASATNQTVALSPSKRTDVEKVNTGTIALNEFRTRFSRTPKQSLCVMLYYTKISSGAEMLLFDLELYTDVKQIEAVTSGKVQDATPYR
jgi:hypothetical protein